MWSEEAIERIRKSGHRITPQRLELVKVLEELGSRHPSLREVYDALRQRFPTLSFSTLYSNLLMLRNLGIVELFSFGGETRVETNTEHHVNVVDEGGIADVNDRELIKEIEAKIGRKVKLVNVLVE